MFFRPNPPTEPGKKFPTWHRVFHILLLAVFLGVVTRGILTLLTPTPPPPDHVILSVLDQARTLERRETPALHFAGFDATGTTVGVAVLTDEIPPAVTGYTGQISTVIGLTLEGRIQRALILRHNETAYYMRMVKNSDLFIDLAGIDLSEPFPQVDSVSGATVSSEAIIRDVETAAGRAASQILLIQVPPSSMVRPNPWLHWSVLLLACILALSIAASILTRPPWLRSAALVSSFIVVGIALNTPFTLSTAVGLLTLNIPGWTNPFLILILAYFFVTIPLFGRSYCRLVCPFGALQHFLNRWWPWKLKPDPSLLTALLIFRKGFLALLLILAGMAGYSGFAQAEPFFSLFSFRMTGVMWIYVMIIIIISLFWRRFWCNACCPTGTILYLLSRATRPRRDRQDETV
jgi:NosR/NirI family nitrous oxide reductase transcriptional regulator